MTLGIDEISTEVMGTMAILSSIKTRKYTGKKKTYDQCKQEELFGRG